LAARLDSIDLEILSQLRNDSKTQVKKMAEKLDVHQNTLIKRIKKMEGDGIICGHKIEIDYDKLGFELRAIVTFRYQGNLQGGVDLMNEIRKMPLVEALYEVTGEADASAIVRARNRNELCKVIKAIRGFDCVTGTTSQYVLVTYKNSCEFNPILEKG